MIKIDSNTILSKIDIRVLDVQIDTIEIRFTRTKNSRKNDETNYDFHKIVDFHLKNNFSQNSNVVHFRCSLDIYLRRLCLTYAQE